jgi:hypothetical protein
MSEVIKAIPTRYAGCHFRSRLEARWAVFFDALGIQWEYEPEGFVGWFNEPYLPDFLLPGIYTQGRHVHPCGEECCDRSTAGVFVEVKPTRESLHRDGTKIGGCIDYDATPISRAGLLILGPIPDPRNGPPTHNLLRWRKGVALHRTMFENPADEYWELSGLWDFQGEEDNVCGECGIPPDCTPIASALGGTYRQHSPAWGTFNRHVERGLTAARSARFEHGENGAT